MNSSLLQSRLAQRPALLGLLQSHPNPMMTELAGMCGYDFVLLDAEHGVFSETDFLEALRILAITQTPGIVRLATSDLRALGRYMDMGAAAIVVPNVSTADQALGLARAMFYPPAGTRGVGAGLHRATRYGSDSSHHMKAPREGVSLIVLIESALGVQNAQDILAVDGVDGAIVGPSDLSADLGQVADYAQPTYTQALARIEAAAAANGKLLGTVPHAGHTIEALFARGHRMFILGSDASLVREALRANLEKALASFS